MIAASGTNDGPESSVEPFEQAAPTNASSFTCPYQCRKQNARFFLQKPNAKITKTKTSYDVIMSKSLASAPSPGTAFAAVAAFAS